MGAAAETLPFQTRASSWWNPGVTPELEKWSGRLDSNQRPPAPKAGALPGCATPRPADHTSGARCSAPMIAGVPKLPMPPASVIDRSEDFVELRTMARVPSRYKTRNSPARMANPGSQVSLIGDVEFLAELEKF